MKAAIGIAMFAFLSALSWSQTAKVIPLAPQEAAQRKALEDKRAAVEQEIKEFDRKIQMQYTIVLEGEPDASNDYVESWHSLTGNLIVGCLHVLSNDPLDEKNYQGCLEE